MIANVTRGSGFGGLQSYLLHGKTGRESGRVEWVAVRNLPAEDADVAVSLMRATAATSQKVEKPVYHVSISLSPEEQLGREAMLRVVDRTLRDLELAQHQAFVVAHNDTPNRHVHVMVNRVHPETGTAWNGEHDYARIETSLRRQERELGVREVPGRHAALAGQERHQGVAKGSGDRHFEGRTGEMAFGQHVRDVARRDLREASSWAELHSRLSEVGLRFEKRGRGLVVTDGERRVKASFVDRQSSLAGLERRLGRFRAPEPDFPAGKSARWADVHGLRRAVGSLQRDGEQVAEQRQGRWDRAAGQHELDRARGRGRAASRALDRQLTEVYRDPATARQAFERLAAHRGYERAARVLSHDPEHLGRLRGRAGPWPSVDRRAARAALPHAASAARELATARAGTGRALVSRPGPRRRPGGRRKAGRCKIPSAELSRVAGGLVRRLGWRVVARVLPVPQVQLLRMTLLIAGKALELRPSKGVGR